MSFSFWKTPSGSSRGLLEPLESHIFSQSWRFCSMRYEGPGGACPCRGTTGRQPTGGLVY
eukprot:8045488-Pyramimonas_sp.AAC.1